MCVCVSRALSQVFRPIHNVPQLEITLKGESHKLWSYQR